MGLIKADRYQDMRRRELAGEQNVFFDKPKENGRDHDKTIDDLELYPIIPPRVRRRVNTSEKL